MSTFTYEEYKQKKKAYQEEGHIFLLERKHACLFYSPGKGKTYPCIDALLDVNESKNGNAKVLVLSTPDAIKNMWETDIVPQGILPKNTILYTFNSAIVEATKAKLLKIKWDAIIIDECHKVKSHNTKTSKLVYNLTKNCEYVWGLSGTPRGNSELDIFCEFHNLNISEWGKISYTQFINQVCDVEQQFFNGSMIPKVIGINSRYVAGWERNIAMYTRRVDYDENDNMPKLNVNVINIPYTPSKEYLQAQDGFIKIDEYSTTMTKLAAISKLHQAVNGFIYLPGVEVDDPRQIHWIERNKKLDWLFNNLTKNSVIVYKFEADLINIKSQLDVSGFSYTEIVNDFKAGKADILLLQCAKCESFNLQSCNRLIYYTLDYSYINYKQMLHRLWRMGQGEEVKVDVLVFEDTVETKIWNAVKNKKMLSDLFMSIKGE